jgi:hypothetical protein
MPIPLPKLDTRNWDELMAEARVLMPRYSPSWTDHNAHDPGVTLAELYAWLAETLLFRLDRISPAQLRTYLRWAGVEQLPAQCARTMVCLRLTGVGPALLAGGAQISDAKGTLAFECKDPIDLSSAWIELSPSETSDRGRVVTVAAGVSTDRSSLNRRVDTGYEPFGSAPAPGDALMLGFDQAPAAPGRQMSIGIWTVDWAADDERRKSLQLEWRDAVAGCKALPNPCDNEPAAPSTGPTTPSWWAHPDVVTRWEYWNGSGWMPLAVKDETRAITISGRITVTGPADHTPGPSDPRYWMRCVVVSGAYDCVPVVAAVGVNAVVAHHAATITGLEAIGASDGSAGQAFELSRRLPWSETQFQGLVDSSVELRITWRGSNDDSWHQRRNWDETLPDDPDFVADPNAGLVAFGNGRRGRVPRAEATISARSYQVGGGSAGNVGAETLTRLRTAGPALEVIQAFPAIGGAEAESLVDTRGRALDQLANPSRPVTIADFETLALSTPGARVARVKAVPGHHPDFPCVTAAGVVTVVVLPACGTPPIAQSGFRAEVARHLEPLRPLTTEVHVVGPVYVEVVVSAVLHLDTRADQAAVASAARQAIDDYLDPLHGGPDRTGWPFGRSVYESELLALLADVRGVMFADGLTITADSACCGELGLCPTALVKSGRHNLTTKGGF